MDHQNGYAKNGSKVNELGFTNPYSMWEWLAKHNNPDLRWVYSRMKEAFSYKADISDSGMMWYLVTGGPRAGGDQRGNPEDLRKFFGGSANRDADKKSDTDTPSNPGKGKTCSATAETKLGAQQKFRQTCGGQWADCDKRKSGGFICSSVKMN